MAPGKLKKAIGRVKDQTKISLAKVGGNNSLSDLDVAIVKATRHGEQPADERHFREIVCITSYSRAHIIACVSSLLKRLNKTKSWTVALKSLMLIQTLLAEGDPAFQQELYLSTRRGNRILNMSEFRDTPRNHSGDFVAFVRTYALYLEERLEYKIGDRHGEKFNMTFTWAQEEESNDKENVVTTSRFRHMKTEQIFTTLQQLQRLLERFLACRPTGAAKCHRVVIGALYQVLKESFQLYYDITEILSIFVDRFKELDLAESLNVHDIFRRQGKQLDELDQFYSWCKSVSIGPTSKYPEIEKITQKKLDLIDELVRDKKSAAQRIEGGLCNADLKVVEEDASVVKVSSAPGKEAWEAPVEKESEKAIVVGKEADLFYHTVPVVPPPDSEWEAFDDQDDCESALVQPVGNLYHQKANLAGGDILMLNGMYQQGQSMNSMASQGTVATRGASSASFGPASRPAPSSLDGKNTETNGGGYPFTAAEPPAYAQLSDMEKQQRFLEDEQTMLEQYKRNGLQGNVGMETVQTCYSQGEQGF